MKTRIKTLGLITLTICAGVFFEQCTHDQGKLPEDIINLLQSRKVSTPPAIDGNAEGMWDDAPKLTVQTTVPNPGNQLWAGYIGKSYSVTMRSLYDEQYIYILAEWNDPAQDLVNTPWYYDPQAKLWAQEPNKPVYNAAGFQDRPAFNEDKFGLQWNMNNSVRLFATQSCYATCHMNSAPAIGGEHYTNAPDEKADLWHFHLMQDAVYGAADDDYIDNVGGQINKNGRHSAGTAPNSATPPVYSTVPGSIKNTQSLTVTGTSVKMNVPLYVIPDGVNTYAYTISDTASGRAQKVKAVETDGVLTLANGTKIDPNPGIEYKRVDDGVSPKSIPGIIMQPYTGGRDDVAFKAVHIGSGWVMEIRRKLKTGDKLAQDVDFSSLADVDFGVAVFDRADNAHAIWPGLKLRFLK